MSKIAAHVNNLALHNAVFALPFAYMGAFLAAEGVPDLWDLLWITVAMISARSAAMGLDNLIDLKYDKQQARLADRPMVTGEATSGEVKVLIVLSFIIFVAAVLQLQPICIKLLPLAAFPFLIYAYTKRFTCCCHLVLGLALAMAPAGGFVAIKGSVTLPIVLLSLAVCLWIAAFDALYGAQDEAFDRSQGLHSLATQFTAAGALKITKLMHLISVLCFIAVGVLSHLAWLYYIGIVIAIATLFYQHSIVSADDFSKVTKDYFKRNGIVSVAIFLFAMASIIMD